MKDFSQISKHFSTAERNILNSTTGIKADKYIWGVTK